MDNLEIAINNLAKEIERKCNKLNRSQIQEHINWVSKLLNIEIKPSGKWHVNYVDAIYHRTIYYLDDLRENGKRDQCEHYLNEIFEYIVNIEDGDGPEPLTDEEIDEKEREETGERFRPLDKVICKESIEFDTFKVETGKAYEVFAYDNLIGEVILVEDPTRKNWISENLLERVK